MFEEISSTALFIYLIILLLSLILLTLLILLIHSGLFSSVKEVGTGKPPLGKVVIAYKFNKGPYNEAGQTFTEASIIAPDNKCLGIYYDDPRKVAAHECRYVVGSILASDLSEVDEALLNRFTEKGFKTITLPEVEFAVKTSFPHVTTLSILIAISKAYPKLAQYIEERKLCAYPFLEFYDGKDIHFYAPLSKQEEFWVSESQQLDRRGDEAVDLSEMNSTLDTSQSVFGDESVDETPRPTPDGTNTSVKVQEVTQEVVGDGISEKTSDGKEGVDGIGNGDGEEEDNDNSSSSSFEVLKNEVVESLK